MTNVVEVNPAAKLDVQYVGNEGTPVMVFDDYALNIETLWHSGIKNANFLPHEGSLYPGIRTELPKDYVTSLLQPIYPYFYKLFEIPTSRRLTPQDLFYSLISVKPEELNLLQSLPHFDSQNPYYLALIHYLAPEPHGDTGLFRHCASGYENITHERRTDYIHQVEYELESMDNPPTGYLQGSTSQFELIHRIPYKRNRVVVYPGTILHSGIIDPSNDISSDPQNGRLTANLFIDFI